MWAECIRDYICIEMNGTQFGSEIMSHQFGGMAGQLTFLRVATLDIGLT